MINDDADGNPLPDTLLLIDFDIAAWGYRAWDIGYYFAHWRAWPNITVMEDFVDAYVAEYNVEGEDLFTGKIMLEIRQHQPYILLEQMLFYYSFLDGYQSPAHLDAYCDIMLNYYERPGLDIVFMSYYVKFKEN